MITLGIDPDTKDLAIAAWGPQGPATALVVHVKGKSPEQSQVAMARELARARPPELTLGFLGSASRVVIEGQQIDARKARTRDLFTLAHTTGSALMFCAMHMPKAHIEIATPTEWKGGVAKHAMQARLYTELGWGYTLKGAGTRRYAVPTKTPLSFKHISAAQWKHVGDALLLARWAYNKSK